MGGAAGTGLGLAYASSGAVVLVIDVPDSMAPNLCRVCRLLVAGLRLSDYAGLEDSWLPGATGFPGTPGLGSRLCAEAKSSMVVVGPKLTVCRAE